MRVDRFSWLVERERECGKAQSGAVSNSLCRERTPYIAGESEIVLCRRFGARWEGCV